MSFFLTIAVFLYLPVQCQNNTSKSQRGEQSVDKPCTITKRTSVIICNFPFLWQMPKVGDYFVYLSDSYNIQTYYKYESQQNHM